jgi:hypothetical protein
MSVHTREPVRDRQRRNAYLWKHVNPARVRGVAYIVDLLIRRPGFSGSSMLGYYASSSATGRFGWGRSAKRRCSRALVRYSSVPT